MHEGFYRAIDGGSNCTARRINTLEYRQGAVWGNPFLRLLRSQLENYIAAELGAGYLANVKNQVELRVVKKEIAAAAKKLKSLQTRKAELEASLGGAKQTD